MDNTNTSDSKTWINENESHLLKLTRSCNFYLNGTKGKSKLTHEEYQINMIMIERLIAKKRKLQHLKRGTHERNKI